MGPLFLQPLAFAPAYTLQSSCGQWTTPPRASILGSPGGSGVQRGFTVFVTDALWFALLTLQPLPHTLSRKRTAINPFASSENPFSGP